MTKGHTRYTEVSFCLSRRLNGCRDSGRTQTTYLECAVIPSIRVGCIPMNRHNFLQLLTGQPWHAEEDISFSWVVIPALLLLTWKFKTCYLRHVILYIVSSLATWNRRQWHKFIPHCKAASYRACWIKPYESSSWPFDISDIEQFRDVTRSLCRCLPELTASRRIQTL